MIYRFILYCLLLLIFSVEFDYSFIISKPPEILRQITIFLTLLLSYIPYLLKSYKPNIKNVSLFFFLGYLFYCLFSAFWSFSASETITSFLGILICLVVCYNIFRCYSYSEFLSAFLHVFFLIVVVSWTLYFIGFASFMLNQEDLFRFKGLFLHTQRLSLLVSVSIILLLVFPSLIANKIKFFIYILLFCITLLTTKTRAFITFTILCSVILNFSFIKSYFVYFLLALFFSFIIFDGLSLVTTFYARGDSDIADLTGRVFVWEALIPLIREKFWLGYGFGAFKLRPVVLGSYVPDHAHNIWLHQIYETGFVGTLLFTIYLIVSLYYAYKFRIIMGKSFLLFLGFFCIMAGLTGIPFGVNSTPLYFTYLIASFYECSKKVL